MELKIGDYVDYKPTQATYSTEKLGENYTGCINPSALTTEELKWRILGVDKEGRLTIISDKPTSQKVSFQNAKGYNNGVYILNDICKTLYSSTELGVNARSLKIEDVEAGFSNEAITQRNNYTNPNTKTKYNQPKTYTGDSFQYPALYEQEKRFWYRCRRS